jgi:hypothetical protein
LYCTKCFYLFAGKSKVFRNSAFTPKWWLLPAVF